VPSLPALTQEAAASALAAIRQTPEGPLADPGSQAAHAAVTALHDLALH